MTMDQAQRRKAVARWHRRVAIVVGIWLVALAASGILINHANDWGLDQRPLPDRLQRVFYGIEAGRVSYCERLPEATAGCAEIFAALALDSGELLAAPHALLLVGSDGQLIEALPAAQLGLARIDAIQRQGTHVFLRDGARVVRSDDGFMQWDVLPGDGVTGLAEAAWLTSTVETISWERLLLDLHAARFLGPSAKVFTDLMAGLILLLGLTGAWLYFLKGKNRGSDQRI